jgi:hypothetical protein
MNSLEQLRSIFDKGTAGLILIGMPGIEKRIARFPQFYSRIGFVHEFRPLDSTEMHELLERRWVPVGVTLPDEPLLPEVIARLIRMTGGNFRLLTRLLTQIERVLEVNQLRSVSTESRGGRSGQLGHRTGLGTPCPPIRQITPHSLRQISPQTTYLSSGSAFANPSINETSS